MPTSGLEGSGYEATAIMRKGQNLLLRSVKSWASCPALPFLPEPIEQSVGKK